MSEGRSSASILFVDDEPSIRLTLPPILAMQGFTVRVAASVASALEEISTHKFDVLLSDLNISKPRDGFLLMNAARAANPLCVAILLTGYPDFDREAEMEKNDLDGYLVKPADIDNLMNIIDQKLASRISSQHPERQNTERI